MQLYNHDLSLKSLINLISFEYVNLHTHWSSLVQLDAFWKQCFG